MQLPQDSKRFKQKTSSDATGLQQNIVLSDVGILAPAIAHLVNVSQEKGIFPDNGKIAKVTNIQK